MRSVWASLQRYTRRPALYTRLVTNRSILARGLRVTHRAAYELISAGPSADHGIFSLRQKRKHSSFEQTLRFRELFAFPRVLGCADSTILDLQGYRGPLNSWILRRILRSLRNSATFSDSRRGVNTQPSNLHDALSYSVHYLSCKVMYRIT